MSASLDTSGPNGPLFRTRTATDAFSFAFDSTMKVLLGVLVVLLLALQYRLWFGDGSLQEVWRLREQARTSQAEVQRLSMRNQALAAEVADLKSGLEAIEERARADLGMIDKDETFYQFVLEQGVRARPLTPLASQPDVSEP